MQEVFIIEPRFLKRKQDMRLRVVAPVKNGHHNGCVFSGAFFSKNIVDGGAGFCYGSCLFPTSWEKNTKANMTCTAIIRKEDDWYVAECADTGTVSQGATIEEALANLKDATELYLEEFPAVQQSAPLLTTFEVSSVRGTAAYA